MATIGSGAAATRRLQLRNRDGSPLAEYGATGAGAAALTIAHVQGWNGRIAVAVGGEVYATPTDLRGSTRIAYGPDGKPAAWFSYRAYGTADAAATSTTPLTAKLRRSFTGQEWIEELGLYDYGARLYDPALGRFLAPDPADETASPYMYVGGDPVGNVDPDGRMDKTVIYAVLGGGGRVWLLDKSRTIRGAFPYNAPLSEIAAGAGGRIAFQAWGLRFQKFSGTRIEDNPLYIPYVFDGASDSAGFERNFRKWLSTVVEDATVPNAIKRKFLEQLDAAHEHYLGTSLNTNHAWERVAEEAGLTIAPLNYVTNHPRTLTPDPTFAMMAAYGKEYQIVSTKAGPVALRKDRVAKVTGPPGKRRLPPFQDVVPPARRRREDPPAPPS
jgi:RHS repeat-associated protein